MPTVQDLSEIDALRQHGLREVTRVTETEFNGQFQRVLSCRYVLRDGREIVMGEEDPDLRSSSSRRDAGAVFGAGPGQDVPVYTRALCPG